MVQTVVQQAPFSQYGVFLASQQSPEAGSPHWVPPVQSQAPLVTAIVTQAWSQVTLVQ